MPTLEQQERPPPKSGTKQSPENKGPNVPPLRRIIFLQQKLAEGKDNCYFRAFIL